MKFLIDEDLPRSTIDLFHKYEYEAIDVRDIGLRGATDLQIASYAKNKKLCIVTGDFDFSDIRNYPPSQYFGLIVLSIPRNSTAKYILNLLESFLKNPLFLKNISGKLAIVEPGRVRWRIK